MELAARALLPTQLYPPLGQSSGVKNLNPPIPGLHLDYGFAHRSYRCLAAGCLLIALRSPIRVRRADQEWLVNVGQSFYLPTAGKSSFADAQAAELAHSEIDIISNGPFLILRGSEITWRVLFEQLQSSGFSELYPLAGLWSNAGALSRLMLSWTRATRKNRGSVLEPADLNALGHALRAAMTEFDGLLERCPGRTVRARMQILSRLLKGRLSIQMGFNVQLTITDLAACANYSRAHFLQLYRQVFDQTPHNSIVERRLGFARDLLSDHGYSVAEATAAAGFEDRSSFSRLFHRHYGVTASAMKRRTPLNSRGRMAHAFDPELAGHVHRVSAFSEVPAR